MKPHVDSLDKIIVIGDRLLLKPRAKPDQTEAGLYLPPGYHDKEKIQSAYVVKAGPGYAVGSEEDDEPWKAGSDGARYIPLQAKPGDLAIYLQNKSHEIEFQQEKYIVVPHHAVLLLIREEEL